MFFYNKMEEKILITGASGFVGKNLVKYLSKIGVPRKNVLTPSRKVLDCTCKESVFSYLKEHKPQLVIHLAGMVGGVKINKEKVADFYYNNIMMGTLMMDESHKNGVKKFIALGAGCGYPNCVEPPYAEEDLFFGLPEVSSYGYSMAKKMLIIQSWAYKEQYGFDSTILLPANLYGPYDNFNLHTSHVIPALVRKFVEADKNSIVEVWGSGMATRDFLFVEDMVRAICDAARINQCGPYNVGTGIGVSIREVVECIKEVTEFTGEVRWDESQPEGQKRRHYNMDKFKDVFGYVPGTSIEKGIKETVEWYRNYQDSARK